MTKFEEFLLQKGCERYYYKTKKNPDNSVVDEKVISYTKEDISTLSIFGYNYSIDGKLVAYYGLLEYPLPPALFLPSDKLFLITNLGNERITVSATQSKHNIFFKQKTEADFDEIFSVVISDNQCYQINENNKIELVTF